MCGIYGAVHLGGEPVPDMLSRLDAMGGLLEHRGPDDAGQWVHPNHHVGLGHTRLAIIDTSAAGHQPMQGPDGSWITYNGETYNHLELRQLLGGQYRSGSDTETVLAAYRKWGTDCLYRLRGMFAFAAWDQRTGQLVLARDRFGVKPLYHATVDGVFYFASEAKALLPFTGVQTDSQALAEYEATQLMPVGRTLFGGVSELPAAHWMVAGKPPVRWWRLEFDPCPGPHVGEIRRQLVEAVDVHLLADVPVASYLSGGLDSSTVTALAQTPAYVGRFREPGFDESVWAQLVTDDLAVVDITPQDFQETIGDIVYHLDFPVAGPGSFPQYVVSRAVREKVVLGGQGGDELFCGYPRMRATSPRAYLEQVWRGPRHIHPGLLDGPDPLPDRIARFEVERILPALLQVEDRVSMAHGLESRVPLLDHRLAEAAARVPAEHRQGKTTLRRAAAPYIPPRIRDRTDKMGFPVPLNHWLKGPLKDWAHETFLPETLATLNADGTYGRRTWGAMCLELWHQQFPSHLPKGHHESASHRGRRVHRLPPVRQAA